MKSKALSGFVEFIRSQGVIGLAVGFILGGSVSKVVSALVEDIINPLISVFVGSTAGLAEAVLRIGSLSILWGHFLTVVIDFLVVAFVIYFGVRGLGLEKLDKDKKISS